MENITESSYIRNIMGLFLNIWDRISIKFKSSAIVASEVLETKVSSLPGIDDKATHTCEKKTSTSSRVSGSKRISRTHHANAWKLEQWQFLHVGDFILLKNNDRIPADAIVISTGEPDFTCYIETKNLDGETNLKIKRGIKEFQNIKTPDDCQKIKCYIDAELPNSTLDSFNGVIHYENSMISLGQNNLLLRGCVLRNTSWLIAIVVYTGSDTKIMLNSGPTPSKRSKVDKQINPLIVLNVVTLCFLSIMCSTLSAIYNNTFRFEVAMFGGIVLSHFQQGPAVAFITFFNILIVFQNIIPIALYISLEVTKMAQVKFSSDSS